MIALLVAQPSLSNSASNSTLVVAAASESTRMVTNLSLSDSRTLATISSIAEKISSTVSKCRYNILCTSTPIDSKNSVLTAVSVSIYTATPPFF